MAEQSETPTTMKEMTSMTHDETIEGPLRLLPSPPDVATRRVRDKLLRYATAATWVPEGLSDELDRLRADHLRVRDRVIAEGRAVAALEKRHRDEEAAYEEALRQAHRDGDPEAEDHRTPPEQREDEHARAVERYWSAVHVLGEKVDEIFAYVRHAEPELLTRLRSRREPLAEKRREAQRLLRDAEIGEWHLHELGQWVQKTTDGVFGAQPAPDPASAPPATFNEQMLDHALERPWHATREALPQSWQEQSDQAEDEIEPLSAEDETGEVSEIVETQEAKA